MRYTNEIISKLKTELENKNGRNSKEIANKLNIPDYIVRQYAVKFNLKFGHFTPFKSNSPINISKELDNIIIGSLLGDGTISKYKFTNNSSTNKNSKLAIAHSIKQKDYVDFKYNLINKSCKGYIKSYLKPDKREGWKDYQSYEVETEQNVSFNKYRDIWYPNNKKVIPNSLNELSPLSLAIWFQDDGTRNYNSGYTLCTNGFTTEEVQKLRNILLDQYSLFTTIKFSTKDQPMIYIRNRSIEAFYKIVSNYICEQMKYKLIVPNKSDKLLETPEEDNQQPI